MIRHESEAEIDAVFDPLSDILFSAIAVLFVALMAIAPALKGLTAESATRQPTTEPSKALYDGKPLAFLVATPDGIRFDEAGATFVPLDSIDGDGRLLNFLAAITDRQLALLVEPGGEEASFVLDPVLSAHGIGAVLQMRLLKPCPVVAGLIDLNTCLSGVAEAVSR